MYVTRTLNNNQNEQEILPIKFQALLLPLLQLQT